MDATCYHMGAPLLHGDVEDVLVTARASRPCPWHHYQISMTTGERLYQDVTKTCALPKKQRVHETKTSADAVLVRLSGGGKPPSPPPGTPRPKPHELPKPDWESDRYAFKAPPPSQGRAAAGGRGGAPSGRGTRYALSPPAGSTPASEARRAWARWSRVPCAVGTVRHLGRCLRCRRCLRAREKTTESVFAEKTEEALPCAAALKKKKKPNVVAYPSYKIVRHTTLFHSLSLLLAPAFPSPRSRTRLRVARDLGEPRAVSNPHSPRARRVFASMCSTVPGCTAP